MSIDPIIPIWLMAIICVVLLCLKRKGVWPYIRQIIMVILLFIINLRISIPNGQINVTTKQMNAYVVLAVDTTVSMQANDYENESTRIKGAKAVCNHILDDLEGAKFCVLTFDNDAATLSTFTDNTEYVKNAIDGITTKSALYARGTSLNVIKDLLTNTLKKAYEKDDGNVIVFFISDGEITCDEELESFKGCKQYVNSGAVLGYGTNQGAKMYVENYNAPIAVPLTDYTTGEDAISVIDEDNLKQIASDMGVTYIHMSEDNDADSLLSALQKANTTSTKDVSEEGKKGIYYYFVYPLVVLFVYEIIVFKRKTVSVK